MTQERATNDIASLIHLHWIEGLGQADGYKPHIVQTTDDTWVRLHGTSYVDLAEYQFEDLPRDWKLSYQLKAQSILPRITEVLKTLTPPAD